MVLWGRLRVRAIDLKIDGQPLQCDYAMKSIILTFVVSWLYFGQVSAQQIPTLDFFHGRECPHCQNEKKWFPVLKQAYPDIVINEYEVWHDVGNQALMRKRLADLDIDSNSVPTSSLTVIV